MNQCPFPHHPLRADLPPLPERFKKLPVDERGYPVPFFVKWLDGKPDFRIADAHKVKLCIIQRLCWVCGEPLRGPKTFAIGPMCSINRISSEPPSHLECAEWSVKGCPFLSKPNMKRREDELTERSKQNVAGIMIERNPGVTLLWTTQNYRRISDGGKGMLFEVGEPMALSWWSEGRTATRAEIMDSIQTGLPLLAKLCQTEADNQELTRRLARALNLLPIEPIKPGKVV